MLSGVHVARRSVATPLQRREQLGFIHTLWHLPHTLLYVGIVLDIVRRTIERLHRCQRPLCASALHALKFRTKTSWELQKTPQSIQERMCCQIYVFSCSKEFFNASIL